jgi:hypothetical protein
MSHSNRRSFLAEVAVGVGVVAAARAPVFGQAATEGGVPDWLPQQDPAVVKEMVGVSHSNLKRVTELLERQPALSNAAVDWGFGDWETALGAASHVGNRPIAELLLTHGARPTMFSAAMLGQLEIVKAFVAASPGVQRTLGPHGITLMAHARAGGPGSAEVVTFLEAAGDADRRPPTQPLEPAERAAVVGEYVFGTRPQDRFVIDVQNEMPGIERPGQSRRTLFHSGGLVFFPVGVPSFRIAFTRSGDSPATQLTLANPDVFLTAKRRA